MQIQALEFQAKLVSPLISSILQPLPSLSVILTLYLSFYSSFSGGSYFIPLDLRSTYPALTYPSYIYASASSNFSQFSPFSHLFT